MKKWDVKHEIADEAKEQKENQKHYQSPQNLQKSTKGQADSVKVYLKYAVKWKYNKGLNTITKKELKELQKTNLDFELR